MRSVHPQNLRAVLFDVDGTLVASNDAHARAWLTALREAGYVVSFAQVRRLIGMGGDKVLPQLAGPRLRHEDAQAILERRRAVFLEEELPGIVPLPGARELVEHLVREGLACTVASSGEPEEVVRLLEIARVADLMILPSPDEPKEPSKPDPDVLEAALDRVGCAPGEVVFIGDTPYDVEASLRAEVAVIAFRSGGWPDVQLRGALALYDGPRHLLREFEGSPLHRGAAPPPPVPWI
jgi:beta-phosphoglucomutase-like phosphatase (HAD superfamily)